MIDVRPKSQTLLGRIPILTVTVFLYINKNNGAFRKEFTFFRKNIKLQVKTWSFEDTA